MPEVLILGVIGVAALLAIVFIVAPAVARSSEGKILGFTALFLAPGIALYAGASAHLERSKTTDFCLSCHVMEPYGKSLRVADTEHLAASHYLNGRVSKDHACYTCHTDYALFGGVRSKLRGLRHVLVQYSGSIRDTVRLYRPFRNRECLHCHLGSRSFEEADVHRGGMVSREEILSEKTSCVSSGCHDVVHDVRSLGGASLWSPPKESP